MVSALEPLGMLECGNSLRNGSTSDISTFDCREMNVGKEMNVGVEKVPISEFRPWTSGESKKF